MGGAGLAAHLLSVRDGSWRLVVDVIGFFLSSGFSLCCLLENPNAALKWQNL